MTNRLMPSCYILGTTTLPIHCAEILQSHQFKIHGMISEDTHIIQWGKERGIPIINPNDDLESILRQKPFDYFFSIINFKIIPEAVLGLASQLNINYHDGPLPRYAGMNTTNWAIINQETEHGVSWHLMSEEIDAGDILEQELIKILPDDHAYTVNARCYEAAIRAFSRLVEKLVAGTLKAMPQDLSKRSYYGLYERPSAASTILWNQPSTCIEAQVRALDFATYDNAFNLPKVLIDDKVYFVKDAKAQPDTSHGELGVIKNFSSQSITVSSRGGSVELSNFSTETGNPISINEVVNTHQLSIGTQLPLLSKEEQDTISEAFRRLIKYEQYWLREIKTFQATELPYIRWEASRSTEAQFKSQALRFPSAMLAKIHALYPDFEAETILLAGLFAFLMRLCNTSSLHVGYSHAGIHDAIGSLNHYFEDTVPIGMEACMEQDFASFLPKFSKELEKVQKRLSYAKELILRYPQRHLKQPDFPIIINYGGNQTSISRANRVLIIHCNQAEWIWEYDSNSLPAEAVIAMQEQLLRFIKQIASDASRPLLEPSLLSEAEYQRLIYDWNETDVPYEMDCCIHKLFEEQVAKTPDAIALVWRDESLTYAQLNQQANQLAHYLQRNGVGTEDFVGIYLNRSIDMMLALIAVHKAGAAYVPLDPDYPTNRIALMIEDAEISHIIVNAQTVNSLNTRDSCTVIDLDADRRLINAESTEIVETDVSSDNLAYLIYTSGSTGKPKGVMVRHRNVTNFFTGMDAQIRHNPPGVWLAVTSISFDISVLELFYTLARGFKLVIYSDDAESKQLSSQYPKTAIDFSLFFFGSHESTENDKYRLLLESAIYADTNGFSAIWTPERHFHAFGGLYPDPSVLSAGLATMTRNLKIRAGSVVSPLHDPIRIAENWSVVDNLSNGRVGISFASGWQPNDFVLAPHNFQTRKTLMFEQVEEVRHLWRGGKINRVSPTGEAVSLGVLPHPIQRELPVWITAAGNPETFRMAGQCGYNILTHLLGQTFDELGDKIRIYREAWKQAGHEGDGHVSLMLHSYVEGDAERAREIVREPLKAYLKSSIDLIKQAAWSFPTFKQQTTNTDGNFALDHLSESELNEVLDFAFERYYESSGLFGSIEQCTAIVDRCKEIGVNEIACFIDYLNDTDDILAHLPQIKALIEIANPLPEAIQPDDADYSIASLIKRHNVSHLQCTPSLAGILSTADDAADYLGKLEQLLIGGEAFPRSLAAQLESLVKGQIINMYGPTETTIWSSSFTLTDMRQPITIGRPIANTQLYVLDEALKPVPVGVPGELYIGGEGVVRGYWKRPELTDERFIANPFSDKPQARIYRTGDLVRYLANAEVEYLGRIDQQVKIRGYRIEMGEIEARLGEHPALRDNVVVAREDSTGNRQIVAYLIASGNEAPSTSELRDFLSQNLPDFMIPSRFITLDKFPLTPNGKVDRLALPDLSMNRPEIVEGFAAAEDNIERILTEIWSSTLAVSPIGVHDNFFELGGHSLLAVSVAADVKRHFGITLPLATFFKAPTIRALAEILRQQDVQVLEFKSLVEIQKGSTSKLPFYCVHAHGGHVLIYNELARYLGKNQPFYGLQAVGVDGTEQPLRSIEEMAARYVSEILKVQPHGPYYIGGNCMGGIIAFEMAQQFQTLGEQVALVAMVDSFSPELHPVHKIGLNQQSYKLVLGIQRLYGLYFKRWWHLPAAEKRRMEAHVRQKLKLELDAWLYSLGIRKSEAPGTETTPSITDLNSAHNEAIKSYQPKIYHGDIVLINASIDVPGLIRDQQMGWRPYVAGRILSHQFPGYYNAGLVEPSVPHLARLLNQVIYEKY